MNSNLLMKQDLWKFKKQLYHDKMEIMDLVKKREKV